MTEQRFKHVVDAFDADGNGAIDRGEFVDFVKFCVLMSRLDELDGAGLETSRQAADGASADGRMVRKDQPPASRTTRRHGALGGHGGGARHRAADDAALRGRAPGGARGGAGERRASAMRDHAQRLHVSEAWGATSAALDALARDAGALDEAMLLLPVELREASTTRPRPRRRPRSRASTRAARARSRRRSCCRCSPSSRTARGGRSRKRAWRALRGDLRRERRRRARRAELGTFARTLFASAALHERASQLSAADAGSALGARVDELIYRCSVDRDAAFALRPLLPAPVQAELAELARRGADSFDALDADGSGALTPDELWPVLCELVAGGGAPPPTPSRDERGRVGGHVRRLRALRRSSSPTTGTARPS